MTSKRRHRVLIGATAAMELREALDHFEERTSGRARTMLAAVEKCVRRLAAFPESSPPDTRAHSLWQKQPRAKGRATHAAGFTIRYAFPVRRGKDAAVVLILSIRDGRRRPLRDAEYVRRFLAELSANRRAALDALKTRR